MARKGPAQSAPHVVRTAQGLVAQAGDDLDRQEALIEAAALLVARRGHRIMATNLRAAVLPPLRRQRRTLIRTITRTGGPRAQGTAHRTTG